MIAQFHTNCPRGGIGRRSGFKIMDCEFARATKTLKRLNFEGELEHTF